MTELIQAAEDGNITEMKRIIYPGWIDHRMVLARFYKEKYNKSYFGIRKNIAEFVGVYVYELDDDYDIDLDSHDEWGQTALHYACMFSRPKCLEILLKFGANPNIRDEVNQTALFIASETDSPDCAEILLKYGAT